MKFKDIKIGTQTGCPKYQIPTSTLVAIDEDKWTWMDEDGKAVTSEFDPEDEWDLYLWPIIPPETEVVKDILSKYE